MWQSGPKGLSGLWQIDPTMAMGRFPVLPNPVIMTVNRKNWGGGRHTSATKYPKMQPMIVLISTLTGMNHQRVKLLRVMDCPRWVKIRHGRKRAKTSLLRSLKVALGTIWIFGWARTRPITERERSFIKGNTALSTFTF